MRRLLILVALLMSSAVTQAAINLGFQSGVQTGNTFNVDLVISGLGAAEAPSLSSYDLDIDFDSTYLTFSHAVFGDSLLGNQLDLANLGVNPAGASEISTGRINLYELAISDSPAELNHGQADSFTLATLSFFVLNAGHSQLAITNINALGDADGNALAANTLASTVTTVPLPAAGMSFASALLGLLSFKRRSL